MATIRDILAVKGPRVASTTPEATIFQAAERMNDDKIGSLVVLDEGRLIGIITERDILQRVVVPRLDAGSTRVADVMTTSIICGRLHTTLEEARGVMKNRRIRHMPVIGEEGELLGVVSIGDLNAYQANCQEQTIYFLQEYITGRV